MSPLRRVSISVRIIVLYMLQSHSPLNGCIRPAVEEVRRCRSLAQGAPVRERVTRRMPIASSMFSYRGERVHGIDL